MPYRFLIRTVKARALKKRSCRTILSNARSCRGVVFRRAPDWRLAWHQRSSGSMPFEYAVDGSTSQTHTGSNSTLLNALTGKCKHLMPNTHRGWTGHCSNKEKLLKKYANIDSKLSQCEDWFGGTTTYTVVSEFDDPTWPCIEFLPKVVWDFVGEQSRVHIMPISAKWKHKSSIHIGFIVFNGGVTTFFAKSVHTKNQGS